MWGHREGPLRAAMRRAALMYESGSVAEALSGLARARRDTPYDGKDLASDEAAALAEGWAFQAAEDLGRGHREAGLEDLAIAEQILDDRPEHGELRGRICVQIALELTDSPPALRSVGAEYLASARDLLKDSAEFRELLDVLLDRFRATAGSAAGSVVPG
jgi:hypothetical protein